MPKRQRSGGFVDGASLAAALSPFNVKKGFIRYFDHATYEQLLSYAESRKHIEEYTDLLRALGFPSTLNSSTCKAAFEELAKKHSFPDTQQQQEWVDVMSRRG